MWRNVRPKAAVTIHGQHSRESVEKGECWSAVLVIALDPTNERMNALGGRVLSEHASDVPALARIVPSDPLFSWQPAREPGRFYAAPDAIDSRYRYPGRATERISGTGSGAGEKSAPEHPRTHHSRGNASPNPSRKRDFHQDQPPRRGGLRAHHVPGRHRR